MQYFVAGFTEILYLVLVGCLDVWTDQHEFFDADSVECLSDGLRRGDGWTAARLLDGLDDGGFVGQAVFHRVGGAVKDDHRWLDIRERLGRFRERLFQLVDWLAKLSGHAQSGDV